MNQLPDSGDRTKFDTGAVRDAMQGKGLPSCIPPIAIRKLAQRFEDGAEKYERHNWTKGIPLSRYVDAIFRHTLAMMEGKTDEDHVGAVLWNAACFAWTEKAIQDGKLPPELDDLFYREPKPPAPVTPGMVFSGHVPCPKCGKTHWMYGNCSFGNEGSP